MDPIDGWKAIVIPPGDAALRSISTSHHEDLEICNLFSSCLDILKRGSPSYKPQVQVNAEIQPPRRFSVINVTSSEYTEEDILFAMTGLESKNGLKGKHRLSMTRRMSKLLVTDTSLVMGDQKPGKEPIIKEMFEDMAEEDEEEVNSEQGVDDVVLIPRATNFSGQMSLPDIIASRDDNEESMTPMARQDSSNEGWTFVSPDSPVIVELHDPEVIESIEKNESSCTPMYRREDSSPEIVETTSLDFYSATPKYRPESSEDTSIGSLESDSDVLDHLSNYSESVATSSRRKSSRPEIISRHSNAFSSYTPNVFSSLASLGQPEMILSVDDGTSFTPRDSIIHERPEVMLESTNELNSMTPLDHVESADYIHRKPSISSNPVPETPVPQYTKQQIRTALESAPKEYAQLVTLNLESTYLDQFISGKLTTHKPSTISTFESEQVYAIIDFAYPKVVCARIFLPHRLTTAQMSC